MVAAIVSLCWLAMAAMTPARAEVSAVAAHFAPVGEDTRFVLEVTGEPVRRIFAVDGPPRLVVDLDAVRFDLDGAPPAAGIVTGWRFGTLSPGRGRIVFDLAGPALVERTFFLPALAGRPARLVIDIAPASRAAFARAAGNATARAEALPQAAAAARPGEKIVVLDPGHGGIDPGAVTDEGVMEKDVALAFARRVADRLKRVEGVAVRLTRSDDRFLSLNQRIRIARAYGADLFISIHADAAPQDWVRGATVYTLSERPSDAQAAALAARENLADTVSGTIEPERAEEVSGILADLLRRETKSYSFAFAETLIGRLARKVRMNSNPHRYARFRVLMAHDIPSVLLELGYLTNAADTEALLAPEWQERASDAVAAAVEDFLSAGPAVAPVHHAGEIAPSVR